MPYGLVNAPSIFQSYMNEFFREYLNQGRTIPNTFLRLSNGSASIISNSRLRNAFLQTAIQFFR